jgi:hypothetical protein
MGRHPKPFTSVAEQIAEGGVDDGGIGDEHKAEDEGSRMASGPPARIVDAIFGPPA